MWIVAHVVGVDDEVIGHVEIAELAGDARVGEHGATRHRDLAPGELRGIADLLDAVNMRGERGDDDALSRGTDYATQGDANLCFRFGELLARRIGRVAHEQVDALGGETREGGRNR